VHFSAFAQIRYICWILYVFFSRFYHFNKDYPIAIWQIWQWLSFPGRIALAFYFESLKGVTPWQQIQIV
jgi:hypothetical protein